MASRTRSTILYSAKYSGLSPETLMFAACIARYSAANLSNSASSMIVSFRGHDSRSVARRERRGLRRPRIVPVPIPALRVVGPRMTHQLDRLTDGQAFEHGAQVLLVQAAAEVETREAIGAAQMLERRQRAE